LDLSWFAELEAKVQVAVAGMTSVHEALVELKRLFPGALIGVRASGYNSFFVEMRPPGAQSGWSMTCERSAGS